jgi:hypothetical protein
MLYREERKERKIIGRVYTKERRDRKTTGVGIYKLQIFGVPELHDSTV